ncbi:MAG: ATP-dependent DNA helicase RecG [Traorella sp.]
MNLKKIATEKKIEALNSLGIFSVEDVLSHYPYRYENHQQININEWSINDKVFTSGIICSSARVIYFGGKKSVTRFSVIIENEEFVCSLFNRPWKSAFEIGKKITLSGTYLGVHKITVSTYNFEDIEKQLGLVPLYSTNQSLTQKDWNRLIDKALYVSLENIQDIIPEEFRIRYRLLKRREALYFIHRPKSQNALKQALRTLKYEEFLIFQCCMQQRRNENLNHLGVGKVFDNEDVFEIMRNLSFDLTNDQKKCTMEILDDLHADRCMMRLLQGDVGSGKTLVAGLAAYACVCAHKQVAFMAPTEILAKQHVKSLKKLYEGFDVQVELYCSSLKKNEKEKILDDLKENKIQVLVGTHALFQEDVLYYDLGLVITDEQHRFGVEQRRKLLNKGNKVDMLLMSATPIPRTLATTLYGDLNVSTIEEYPKGRNEIITHYVSSKSMKPILKEVLEKIDEQEQCYVVCPSIEENEDYQMSSVVKIYEGMCKVLKKYRIGLLHGQMKTEKKDEIMNQFMNHELDILVSTTVIEVGVDVSNANIMIIYDAHRFGLSQIHQLRGRVGRGQRQGYCYLLSDTKDEESIARLKKLEECRNGFELSYFDLQLRGPGDILGKRQSGLPSFILGDFIQDSNIIQSAKNDAKIIVEHMDEYPKIKEICEKYTNENKYFD